MAQHNHHDEATQGAVKELAHTLLLIPTAAQWLSHRDVCVRLTGIRILLNSEQWASLTGSAPDFIALGQQARAALEFEVERRGLRTVFDTFWRVNEAELAAVAEAAIHERGQDAG